MTEMTNVLTLRPEFKICDVLNQKIGQDDCIVNLMLEEDDYSKNHPLEILEEPEVLSSVSEEFKKWPLTQLADVKTHAFYRVRFSVLDIRPHFLEEMSRLFCSQCDATYRL